MTPTLLDGTVDALDQLDDEPSVAERIIVYRLNSPPIEPYPDLPYPGT
ncbi:MAG TPA: hypothetical protein P5534_21835 [Candidatus Paceibacterota bacterium]|nr:hypothetical protein [Candidatus Paceibacterota bacterium]